MHLIHFTMEHSLQKEISKYLDFDFHFFFLFVILYLLRFIYIWSLCTFFYCVRVVRLHSTPPCFLSKASTVAKETKRDFFTHLHPHRITELVRWCRYLLLSWATVDIWRNKILIHEKGPVSINSLFQDDIRH